MIKISNNHGDVKYNSFKFSGGELQVKVEFPIRDECDEFGITANIACSDDVMELLMVTDALKRGGAKIIHLICPYLPYARQDRVCDDGEALSLKVFCDMINLQDYASVNVWDVHSDVALALINRVYNVHQYKFVSRIKLADEYKKPILVAPDAGALKKIIKVAQILDTTYFRSDKIRDVKTGNIVETVVHSFPTYGQDLLIVDDICDGGRTFIELAKKLKRLTSGKINLYVTHGIFSQGLDVFDDLIDQIYCPNVFPNVPDHKLLKRI